MALRLVECDDHGVHERTHVSASSVRAVVQTRHQGFVTVCVDVIQVVVLDLLQRTCGNHQNDTQQQTEESGIEGCSQSGSHVSQGAHEDIHAPVATQGAGERTDGTGETEDCSDEPEERDDGDEQLHAGVTAADSRGIDAGLVFHHGGHLGIHLAGFEQFKSLANTIHHHGITQLRRDFIQVIDECPDVVPIDVAAQLHRQHIQGHGGFLMFQLENLQNQDAKAPAEEDYFREIHPPSFEQEFLHVCRADEGQSPDQARNGKTDSKRRPRVGVRRVSFRPAIALGRWFAFDFLGFLWRR